MKREGRTGPGKVLYCLSVNNVTLIFVSANVEQGELLKQLVVVQKDWMMLGTFLGVEIETIDNTIKCSKLMLYIIQKWITESEKEKVTIDAIIKALESGVMGNNRLAKKIREDPEIKRVYGYKPPCV